VNNIFYHLLTNHILDVRRDTDHTTYTFHKSTALLIGSIVSTCSRCKKIQCDMILLK